MRSFRELAGQVLAGKVSLFVKVGAPFGSGGYIVDNAMIRDEFPCAALTVAAFVAGRFRVVQHRMHV
jgi:hypothetical protein